jgi:hypothetical protein
MSEQDLQQLIAANTAVLEEVKKLLANVQKPGLEQIEEKAKEDIINFMLEHMNIKFINDDTERNIYEAILNVIFAVINKIL